MVRLHESLSHPNTALDRLVERLGDDPGRFGCGSDGSPSQDDEPAPALAQSYRPNRILSPGEVVEVVQRYQAGTTIAELATAYGAHRTTISRALNKANCVTRYHKGKISPELLNELTTRYQAGASTYELGIEHGLAASSVRRALMRAGVTLRPARKFNR